jgi:putative tricarboxylic transport membrane protein
LSRGDPSVFFTSPLSAILLAIAAISILLIALPNIRAKRDEALQE